MGGSLYAEEDGGRLVSGAPGATASVQCDVCHTHPDLELSVPILELFPYCCDFLETSDDQDEVGSAFEKDQSASSSRELFTFDYWNPDQVELPHPGQEVSSVKVVELEETLPSLEIAGGQLGLGGQKIDHAVRIHDEVLTMKNTIQRTEAERLKYLDKQRLNHIRVERNRRKKMNKNIALLKDMLPPYQRIKVRILPKLERMFTSFTAGLSHVHNTLENDQASIIGGVVEFISELQQLLNALQERKQRKQYSEILSSKSPLVLCPPVSSSLASPTDGDLRSASRSGFQEADWDHSSDMNDTFQVNTALANVVVTKSQTFMDVLIETLWSPRQLIQIIVALQSLYLEVVQMTIEEENKKTLRLVIKTQLGSQCRFSVKELATSVHQSVTYMHLTTSSCSPQILK